METGHDIIFFWVARMMMMGIHFMGEVPFRTVYLHPMVRDEKGQKMSKTKGNVIDPLVITEEYGADALRFTLAALTAQGRDIKLAKERIEGYRAFANKLWNATRFALMNLEGHSDRAVDPRARRDAGGPLDPRAAAARRERHGRGARGLPVQRGGEHVYQFVWDELCDWYIELAKEALYGDDAGKKVAAQATLAHALETALLLLHPFMPFITEELWHVLRARVGAEGWPDSILAADYPRAGEVDEAAERGFGPVIGIVEAIRNIRGEMNIPFKVVLEDVEIGSLAREAEATVREELGRVHRLANVKDARVLSDGAAPAKRGRARSRSAPDSRSVSASPARSISPAEIGPNRQGNREVGPGSRLGRQEAREPELRREGAARGGREGPRAARRAPRKKSTSSKRIVR